MNDNAVKADNRPACASCEKNLFGQVKFCPFCGEAQDGPRSTDLPNTVEEAPSKPEPLTNELLDRGKRAESEAARLRVEKIAPSVSTPVGETAAEPSKPPEQRSRDRYGRDRVERVPGEETAKAELKPVADDSETGKNSDLPKEALTKRTAPSPSPPVTPQPVPGPKPSGTMKWLWPLILVGGAYWGWQAFSPTEPDACQQALEGAAASMQSGNFAQAKAIALGAVARCTEASQDRAKALLKDAEFALAAEEKCNQGLQLAGNQIADGRLKLANRTLTTLPGSCTGAMVQKIQIEDNRTSAAGKLTEAQDQVASGRFEEARALVNDAERLDQDNADIARTRARIAQAEREAVRAETPPVALPALSGPPEQQPPQRPTDPIRTVPSAEANKQLECSILVRSGERALVGNSYDVAMQNARDAQMALPNCPGARELFKRARNAKDTAMREVVIN